MDVWYGWLVCENGLGTSSQFGGQCVNGFCGWCCLTLSEIGVTYALWARSCKRRWLCLDLHARDHHSPLSIFRFLSCRRWLLLDLHDKKVIDWMKQSLTRKISTVRLRAVSASSAMSSFIMIIFQTSLYKQCQTVSPTVTYSLFYTTHWRQIKHGPFNPIWPARDKKTPNQYRQVRDIAFDPQ